ncbi:MAG: hypothetical protein PHU15_05765 [Sphaerochaetaceae bacterium]|jgi:hypothetical protein|nr:hypothetical protein [Sphaerochaetaceae bacterium]HHU89394.1 hypothetical protein [Spirochaetales bacterium]
MGVERFYYQSTINEFLQKGDEEILGTIVARHDFSSLELTQRKAWGAQITILRKVLATLPDGLIVFEYIIVKSIMLV